MAKFAAGFNELPAVIPGRGDYRILMSISRVVRAYTVVGEAGADGAVELVSLVLDTDLGWTEALEFSLPRAVSPFRDPTFLPP